MFDSIETIHGFDSAGRTKVDCLGYVLSSRFLWEDRQSLERNKVQSAFGGAIQRLSKPDDVPSFKVCLVSMFIQKLRVFNFVI